MSVCFLQMLIGEQLHKCMEFEESFLKVCLLGGMAFESPTASCPNVLSRFQFECLPIPSLVGQASFPEVSQCLAQPQ